MLNLEEFMKIKNNLAEISEVWSDLWLALFLSQAKPTQVLKLKFQDVKHNMIILPATKGLAEKCIPLTYGLNKLIRMRRNRFPDDIFIFQNHTNSSETYVRPVTFVAFSRALRKASKGVTIKPVSSCSAYSIKMR